MSDLCDAVMKVMPLIIVYNSIAELAANFFKDKWLINIFN